MFKRQDDGHLDRRNGRFCITPEFPGGTYAYFMTMDASNQPEFPYILGEEYYGDAVTEADTAPANPVFEQPAAAGCTIGTQIGVVDTVTVDSGGVGYTYANVTFSGGGGTGAAATSNLSVLDGFVSSLTIDNPGSGYSVAPTVNIAAPNVGGGIQATGNHPGRARNPDELRADLEFSYSKIPGSHRLNLQELQRSSHRYLRR